MTSAKTKRSGYTVTYNSDSHLQVLFQMWGSVWPKVIPYCIFNVILSAFIAYLDKKDNISLAISDKGHSFMNLMVAFLIVSRVTISMGRYNESRGYLGVMYRECRELIQNMVVLSGHNMDTRAKVWRNHVAYRTCVLLRSAMAVIDYPEEHVNVWDLDDIDPAVREDMKRYIYLDTSHNNDSKNSRRKLLTSSTTQNALRWGHGKRTYYEENMRVPVRQAYLLRKELRRQRTELKTPLAVTQELKLGASVDSFMNGYSGMLKFITTPFPFPLVQMARTFLFFYVFTVPFALLSDKSSTFSHCAVVFILTFGFMGLEYVAIELDNPFGHDDNDFDNLGMALTAFEDTYLSILDVDGPRWTDRLRVQMNPMLNKKQAVQEGDGKESGGKRPNNGPDASHERVPLIV